MDPIIPSYINHIMHTLPIVSLILESFITHHKYPSFLKGAILTGSFTACYILWTLYIAYESGNWVYPILRNLTPLNRGLFIGSQVILSWSMFKFGGFLNTVIWGDRQAPASVTRAKKSS